MSASDIALIVPHNVSLRSWQILLPLLGMPADRAGAYAAVGALTLYLDFTNLFLFLLRLTGNRRQSNG